METPAPITAAITNLQKSESWLKTHERLLIVFAIIISLLFLGNKYLEHEKASKDAANALAQQKLDADKAANVQFAAQVAAMQQQYAAIVQQMTAQEQQLIQTIEARDKATQVQQHVDAVLPLPQVAIRWENLVGLQPDDVKNVNNTLVISDNGAHKTVEQLELVPNLEKDIADGKVLLADKDKQIAAGDDIIADLNKQVGGLNTQIQGEEAAYKAQIAAVKSDARVGKRNWFLRGVGVGAGIVLALVIHGGI